MNDNMLLRFTEAEFLLMLALSGGENCTVCLAGSEPDDVELTDALAKLYGRDMLQQESGQLVPSGDGKLFLALPDAKNVVMLYAKEPRERTAICYLIPDGLWLAEIVNEGFRMQKMGRDKIKSWLFDAGILKEPSLYDSDVSELSLLYREELDTPTGRCLLHMEKRRNGGGLLCEFYVRNGPGDGLLQMQNGIVNKAEFYTVEALSHFLDNCFSDE